MSYNHELYHYGRLGMKWGQHKYQNKYGGLNSAGRSRVRQLEDEHDNLSDIGRLSAKGIKRRSDIEKEYQHLTGKVISERVKTPTQKPKSLREMSNEELTAYNTRKQLETTYLGYQQKPEKSKGKKFATAMGKHVVAPLSKEVYKQIVMPKVMNYIKQLDAERMAAKALK